MHRWTVGCALLLVAPLVSLGGPALAGDAGAGGAAQDLRAAPEVQVPGAPPESQLSPRPEAEKSQAPDGFHPVTNPAFPLAEVRAVSARRGRRYEAADLSPYFAGAKLAQARAAFDRGHYAAARALLDGQGDSLPIRYLRALSAARANEHLLAGGEFAALAEDYTALADRCRVHAGVAYEGAGLWKEASLHFAEVPERSNLHVDARLGLSRALKRQGDLAGAARALESLAGRPAPPWGRDVGAEALIALADLARDQKNAKAERAHLVQLWARHPLSPLAALAEERLGGSRGVPVEARVTRGEVLVEAHRNRPGIDVLEPLLPTLKLPDPLACRAHFAHGKGLRKERLHTKAIAALVPVVDKCKEPDVRARALYVLGSSRSISDLTHAPATYEVLAAEFPAHSFADDALFYAADVYAKLNQPGRALQRLEDVAERYPGGDFAAEALFKVFWLHRSAGRDDEAVRVLGEIEERYASADETYDHERARYWRARLLEQKGNKADAAAILEGLAVNHPATYYGLLARTRLGALAAERAKNVTAQLVFDEPAAPLWPLHAGTLGDDPHFLAGVELLRLGFFEAVPPEVLAAPRNNQPAEALRLLVHVLSAAKDQRGAHAVARTALRRDLSGRPTPQTRAIWEIAYPNAFRDLIERYCREAHQLDPDLLQALMREESALDPKALSWAGALGLTQLMPSTARAVARQLKLPRMDVNLLLEPEVNIRLGAHYLGNLSKRFGGTKQFALAGYNAGEHAVTKWRADRPDEELDVWVENIPIAETRGYVKRVLRSYNTYQLLYRGKRTAMLGTR